VTRPWLVFKSIYRSRLRTSYPSGPSQSVGVKKGGRTFTYMYYVYMYILVVVFVLAWCLLLQSYPTPTNLKAVFTIP
jgi:hypothetical protein